MSIRMTFFKQILLLVLVLNVFELQQITAQELIELQPSEVQSLIQSKTKQKLPLGTFLRFRV